MSCRLVLSLLFSFLLVRSLEARSIGNAASAVTVSDEIHDFAIDLHSSSFEAVLKESPANFAIVEFFAHWSPACRNYKPHYEKVAKLFNGPNAVHPGVILMTRVDCADKVNTDLCEKFSVIYYPVLLWGPPIEFVAGRWDPKQENSEIRAIDDGRTAQHLLNWINKRISSGSGGLFSPANGGAFSVRNKLPLSIGGGVTSAQGSQASSSVTNNSSPSASGFPMSNS